MALQLVPPPQTVWNTYQQSLLDFIGPHQPETELFHLPVGIVALPDLARGATVDDIVTSGCRFVAAWPDGRVTSCEMTNPTLYGQALFRNYVEGGMASQILASIQKARALPAVQAADFDLHYLTLAGIGFEALHLVSGGSGNDLVLPVISSDEQFGEDVLDAAAFFAEAGPVAAARLALPASPLSS